MVSFATFTRWHTPLLAMASSHSENIAAGANSRAQPPEQESHLTQRSLTIRSSHTYLHLVLLTSTPSSSSQTLLDLLTARTYLTSALSQYLGLTGTAIPIDFLKIEGRGVWIRIPREDGVALVGALSQWVGKEGDVSWRVQAKGEWLGSVVAGNGDHLFEP